MIRDAVYFLDDLTVKVDHHMFASSRFAVIIVELCNWIYFCLTYREMVLSWNGLIAKWI